MSILKELINEMGASGSTSAHAISTTPNSLFGGGVIDPSNAKKKHRKMMRRVMQYAPVSEDISSGFGNTDFDPSDVLSKIDSAQKKSRAGEDDTVAFGLEDEAGNIVKVYVKDEQAEDFEKALGDALSGADEDDSETNTSPEIAEVLYKLKDRFDIVDAEFPEIETDEEQEQEVGEEGAGGAGGEGGDVAAPGEEGDAMAGEEGGEGGEEGAEGEGGEEEMGMEDEMGGEDAGATSALQSVIDVMKADAEAKKADADARAAEAKAKEAEYAAQSAAHKVKQEEQVLDMEAYNNQKKEQEDESKKLAQLAKYQHDKASDMEGQLSGGYEVSMESMEGYDDPYIFHDTPDADEEEATLEELSQYILDFLRGQK